MRTETRNRLFDIAFFLVEAFASLEVTAVIVANARISQALTIPARHSSLILNSYLYPLFACMGAFLFYERAISRRFPPRAFYAVGLALFTAGNLLCAFAPVAAIFFVGRFVMGIGGAIAFTGQLWTVSLFHAARITTPLVYGEIGAALGVVAGPLLGGVFTSLAPGGWRGFFLFNGALAAAASLMIFKSLPPGKPALETAAQIPQAAAEASDTGALSRRMTLMQVLVSMLTVGAEYLFSGYLQSKLGRSPLFVGGMTFIASIGIIIGSLAAGRMPEKSRRIPGIAIAGIIAALIGMTACLATLHINAAALPILLAGLFMGLANVSIYAAIVQHSRPAEFLNRSLVYLIGMQIGNALGIQAVGLAEVADLSVIATTAVVLAAAALAVAVYFLIERLRARRAAT